MEQMEQILESISEEQVRALLTFNFCPADFVYDCDVSPVHNLVAAIEMFGENQRCATLDMYQ